MSNIKQLNKHKNNKNKSEMKHKTLTFRFLDMSRSGFARLFLLLLLPCLSVIGVKATDSNGGVKFNPDVRYSQWAINSRLHDFYGNQKKFGFDYYDKNGTNIQTVTWYNGKTEIERTFDYVAGLVGKASLETADFYQDFDWSKPWFYAAQGYATGTPYANTKMTLDNMNAAKMYFPILAGNLKSPEAITVANQAIADVINDIKTYNTKYIIGGENSTLNNTNANDVQKTMFGGWFHKSTDYTDQMWCDGQYMGPALLAQIITHTNKTDNISNNDWDIIAKQFSITWAQLYDNKTGLLYHGFTAYPGDDASKAWAGISKDKVYHSASFWGRANAWYFLALVDVLEAMKNAGQENTDNYTTLKQHLTDLAAGIAARQDGTTGGWYQVMDQDASFKATSYNSNWSGKPASVTNYIETSATAIFAAAYFKAVRLGLLSSTTQYDYKTIAKNAFEGLVNNYTYLDANGDMQIWGSCKSAGLGGGTGTDYAAGGKKYRDGSNEYYLLGYDVPMVSKSEGKTEGKVLGGFIMAATEYERAYQNQNKDSKQILFAKDLAPSYNFTTTAGTLDATAYGNGTVSYQWYKDDGNGNGTAIAAATSATFTPTVTGNYYCVAKSADGKTIRTSTTAVTTANTDNGSTDNNNGSNDNGTASEGTVTFSGDQLKNYSSPMKDATEIVTIATSAGTIQKETAGDIKVKTSAAFTISVAEGKYIKNITYTIKDSKNGELTFEPTDANKVTSSDKLTYTYNYSDNKLSTVTATNANKSGIQVTSIKVVYGTIPTVKKYRVSATAGTGGSVSIVNASGTTITSGSEVEENTSLIFTAKPNDGYEFVNWTDASNNSVLSTETTYTTTVTAAISLTANFKAKTPVTPTENEVIYKWGTSVDTSVGTTTYGISCTSNKGVITFSSNFNATDGKYITIKPNTGGFKAGDVITLQGYCNSKNLSGVDVYSDVNGKSIFRTNILAKQADGGSEFTFTLTEDCDALYLGRFGGGTTCLTSLQVERPASSGKTRLTASFEQNAKVVVLNTTSSVTLPDLTVKAGDTPLYAERDYTVVYESNAKDVAALSDNNTITIKSLGIATITATITPKDPNTYEGTTATYQLSIKAPSPLNVSAQDVTINTTDAEVEQPVIKVYGDGDKLLKLDQDYTLSYEVSEGSNVSFDDKSGKFTVTKTDNKWTKGTSLITVTATPTDGNNYMVGTLQFSYSVVEGKIKPVFLDSFKDNITIKLHKDNNKRTITVPLIYNGEDVSSYFNYTYTINGQVQKVTENTLNYTPSTVGTYIVTVTAVPGTNGVDDYSDVYDSPDPISFKLDVKENYKVITVTPAPINNPMYTGTTQVAPDLTVTDGNTTLADTEYQTFWFSTSPGVVKVDATTGKIEAVSEGSANVRVVVTGDNLESTTALITIDVDDRAVYRVHANEVYKNQTTMWNQDHNLSVTLGGWLFPNDGTPNSWITSEKLSRSVEWNNNNNNYYSRKATWKITGFDYMVTAGDKQKNARQENGSNSMPETTLISDAKYSRKEYIVDPMFNVPCSGSFLTFQPVTNGTVIAHIYQNGVFDSTKKKDGSIDYQYRPQRRVFIMDEAGNFVSSDAHIESTTGQPNGKHYTLSDYKWDLDGNKAPTVDSVKTHFGLDSFEMSATGFKNNVYENQLDQGIAPNQAAKKYPDLKGSHGWSVLADAPVTYTFKVKAGKTYYLYNFGSKIGFYGFSFDEDETKPIVDNLTFYDDRPNTIDETKEGHVAQVSINRSMTANIWTTCVLPFSLNKEQVDAIFGETYSATKTDGTQILYFDHVEGNKVYFVRHAYNTIVAGKPFLIKPSKEVASINTAATDYPYVTIEKNTKPTDWCTLNGYTWASSYNNMTVKEGDGFISNKDGSFKNFEGKSGKLKGFRGYLKRLANQSTGAKPMKLQVVNSSNIDGDNGETTGIEDLIIDANGQLMPTNGKVYNINGQLVSEDANSFQSLPSGIYIINGKKYIK